MTVKRILDSQRDGRVSRISPDALISDVLDALAFANVGALVVSQDGDTVEGIISERDIVRAIRSEGASLLNKRVSEVMTIDVITCVAEDRAAGIMELMVSRHLRHIPVLENNTLVNMVSIRDLLQLRLDELDAEARAMRDYISGPPNPVRAAS